MVTETLSEPIPAPGWLRPGLRIYAIGDVHGLDDRLAALHARIAGDIARRPPSTCLLIHLGDYVDRGPDSAAVLARLSAPTRLRVAATYALRGNHEQMLIQALDDPEAAALWLHNDGQSTLASWGISPASDPRSWAGQIPAAQLWFVRSLPLVHRCDGYVFVHAGLRPSVTLDNQVAEDLLWIRKGFLDWPGALLPEAPELVAVHGHTPIRTPEVKANRIGLDTGAVQGGNLTCGVLEGRTIRFLTA